MAKHRTHSIEFKRQVAQEFLDWRDPSRARQTPRRLPKSDPGLGAEV